MRKHGQAAPAHQLDLAPIAAAAERGDAFDGFDRIQRDVEEDKIRHPLAQRRSHIMAVGKSLGIEASAVENEREELPDARVAVDHEAERDRGPGGGRVGLTRCRRRFVE